MVSKKSSFRSDLPYSIVKIHVKNDVTIVLEFLIFLVVKKIEENYPK